MKNHSVSERGQVLVLIALAIIGLVGITGVAIDGSMILADRRHAQNAADTAALAGALTYIQQCEISGCNDAGEIASARAAMKLDALDRAISNGYYPDLLSSQVDVYACNEVGASCPAPYTGKSDYLQVIITSHVDTFFARVVGIPQLHNRVQAVALADDDDSGSLFGGAGIVALNPDCPNDGAIKVTGGADITISGGGMFSNSDDACAVKCSTSAGSFTICNAYDEFGTCTEEGVITTAGGDFTFGGHCETNMTGDTSDGGIQLDYHDDVPDIPEPPECDGTNSYNNPYHVKDWFDNPATGTTVWASYITPGYYLQFPPTGNVDGVKVEKTLILAPGVYCVDTVYKQTSDGISVFGDDVTIYVRPGNDVRITGGVIQLRATNGTGALYKPHDTTNAPYIGYLFIVAPDYDGAVTSCVIDGNSYNIMEGAFFAPHCDVTINGGTGTPPEGINSQIIGYTVTINGTADLTINYDEDKNPYIIDDPKIGVTK